MVYCIIEQEYGLMSWPPCFEKRYCKVLWLVLHIRTGLVLSFLCRFEDLSALPKVISV